MKFARIVFVIAGVWGIVVVTPLYFLRDVTGLPYAAPTLYPHFFYGFLSVTMAWQIAFLMIGSNPVRWSRRRDSTCHKSHASDPSGRTHQSAPRFPPRGAGLNQPVTPTTIAGSCTSPASGFPSGPGN